jgi:hypothetical protein
MSVDRDDQPIVRADPMARAIALGVFAVATLAGFLLMRVTAARIAELERLVIVDLERAREETIQLLWVLTGVGSGLALIAAAALASKSRAIRRADRYPLPGARVLRDTVVRTGSDARRVARLGYTFAVGLALGAIGLLVTVRLTVEALSR